MKIESHRWTKIILGAFEGLSAACGEFTILEKIAH